MTSKLDILVAKAIAIRDGSLARVEPPLGPLPDPLPLNVTGVPRQLLTEEECEITETEPIALVEKISKGEYTSVAVTKAFLRRAALAQKLVSCFIKYSEFSRTHIIYSGTQNIYSTSISNLIIA